jgi:folate-binding Fe-S cluster repair protein YgfZ
MATSLFHSTIQVSGAEFSSVAAKFLQGQLTCDVNKIGETLVLGAHCNPKGRVISLFWLAQKNKEFT